MKSLFRIYLALLIGGIWVSVAWAAPDAPGEFRFRLGPFFEWNSQEGAATRLAVRPFFAWEKSSFDSRDKDMEVLWPLSHFGWRGDEFHWRVGLSFWREEDVHERFSRDYSFITPPLWVNGRDDNRNYWGLFPVYGKMPKVFLVEEVQWALFPLWLRYRTGGSQGVWRDYFGWPFFSLKYDDDKTRWALWPLYGTKKERGFKARFVLWPFWNDRTFNARNHNGYGFMLWPLVERVNTDTEQSYGLLPPFFRYTETTSDAMLLRCPWPLFERYTDPKESTWKVWRFWGMTHRGTRDGWWLLHPIVQKKQQKTVNLQTRSFRVWPFYTHEESYGFDVHGEAHLQTRYFRIWPFYSSAYNDREGLKRKGLVLFPIRDVPVIERNLAPFWTFYTARQTLESDEVLHELFWGLIWWRTHRAPDAEAEYDAGESE